MEWDEFIEKDNRGTLPLLTEEQRDRLRLIQLVPEPSVTRGERVAKLISSPFYVTQETEVGLLAEEWQGLREIENLGVVDGSRRPLGLISREDFFTALGKPYAMEILGKKEVLHLCGEKTPAYPERMGILQLSGDEENLLARREDIPYLVVDDEGHYSGIFTTRDLLLYLSEITRRDIALARGLQERIVPKSYYTRGEGYELVGAARMAKGVGGDFFFHRKKEHETEKLFWSLCDVSGKGVSASLVTTFLWGIISSYSMKRGIGRLIKLLNDRLIQAFAQERFVTGVFFEYRVEEQELILADMGHGHLLLLRGNTLHELPAGRGNLPLGVVEDLSPELKRISLLPGDMVVALSDGMGEQTNMSGDLYPMDRLRRLLVARRDAGLKELDKEILDDFRIFRGARPQHDDVSFSLMRVLS